MLSSVPLSSLPVGWLDSSVELTSAATFSSLHVSSCMPAFRGYIQCPPAGALKPFLAYLHEISVNTETLGGKLQEETVQKLWKFRQRIRMITFLYIKLLSTIGQKLIVNIPFFYMAHESIFPG